MCVGITWYHIIISHQFPNLYSHEAWPVAPTSCSTAWLPIQSPRPELESGRPSGKKQRGRKTWKNVGKIWKHIWKTAHYGEKNMANYGKTWRKMGRTRTARKLGKPYFFWNYISKTLGNGQTTIGNSEELFFFGSCLQELLCACYRLKKLRAKNLIEHWNYGNKSGNWRACNTFKSIWGWNRKKQINTANSIQHQSQQHPACPNRWW